MRRNPTVWIAGLASMGWIGAAVMAQDAKPAKDEIAGYIGEAPITLKELDAKILKTNMKLAQQLYDARKAAIDDVILERALADEAKSGNISVEQLLRQKVVAKASPVTDEEVKAYFDANQSRMGGRTYEQVGPQIKQMLAGQKETAVRNGILSEIKAAAKVRVTLDAPRVEFKLAANDPVKGPATAKVTIVEFSEFQ